MKAFRKIVDSVVSDTPKQKRIDKMKRIEKRLFKAYKLGELTEALRKEIGEMRMEFEKEAEELSEKHQKDLDEMSVVYMEKEISLLKEKLKQ